MTDDDRRGRRTSHDDAWDPTPTAARAPYGVHNPDDDLAPHAHDVHDAGDPEPSVDLPMVDLPEGLGDDVLGAEPLPDPPYGADDVSDVHGVSEVPPVADELDLRVDDPIPVFHSQTDEASAGDPWFPPSDPRPVRARVKVRPPSRGGPPEAPSGLTGERHEDSLLFDMSLVPAHPLDGAHKAPTSSDDASGLVDVARFKPAPPVARPSRPPPIDDILGVGVSQPLVPPPARGLLGPIVPPSLPPPPSARRPAPTAYGINKTVVAVAAVIAFIFTVGLCFTVVLLHDRPVDSREPTAPTVVVATPPPTPAPVPSVPPMRVVPTVPTVPVSPSQPPVVAPSVPMARHAPTPLHHAASPSVGARTAPHTNPSTEEPAVVAVASPEIIPPPADLPEAPTRAEVIEALQPLTVIVQACGTGTDPAVVDVLFAGSGRVTTATVRPPYAGTPTGSCIARSVRAARVGPFARPIFRVSYPFSMH